MNRKFSLQSELTEAGEQTFVSGVRPVTLRDQLTVMINQPLQPKRNPNAQQKPCDVGLFDEVSRNQTDLLDYIAAQHSPVKF